MKNILVIYYSQTGQLTSAVKSLIEPLTGGDNIKVHLAEARPWEPYPFPWSVIKFFDVFPESYHMKPPPMEPFGFDPEINYDLVIIAYQVWFLAPSLPITGFLRSKEASVLKDKPVITLIVCRNMWLSAQKKVKKALQQLGGHLIDNVTLVDKGPPLTTFITTPLWMLTGKKKLNRLLPEAGVSTEEIRGASRFGRAIKTALESNKPLNSSILYGLGAVRVNPNYIASEKIGSRSFYIWGKLLLALGQPGDLTRRVVLCVYIVFLILMILTVVPIGVIIRSLLKLFQKEKLSQLVIELEKPSGSGTERLVEFDQ